MRRVAFVLGIATAALTGCDDQIKYVPWFSTMSEQPAVETFEQAPREAPEGAVSLGDSPEYSLAEADTALSNPLRATSGNVARGGTLFRQFCTPCHGASGRGDGPVIMSDERPRGIPGTPFLDLHSESARGRSDGYMWGIITNGRGALMPSYRRIPPEERWHVVLFVRHLQQTGGEGGQATGRETGAGGEAAGGQAAGGQDAGGDR